MSQLLPQFEDHKGLIPEFIVKLYHILEVFSIVCKKKQYEEYLCWNGDYEVLIKSAKKLQEKVLPHFFRHKHISSFIRQLNMYKFSKVAKLSKQRNHMYFKNQFFQRGNMYVPFKSFRKQLLKIKRNNKKNRTSSEFVSTPTKSLDEEEQVSIMNEICEQNEMLLNYKCEIRKSFSEIKQILAKVIAKYPQATEQLKNAKLVCEKVMESKKRQGNCILSEENQFESFSEGFEKNEINNMLTTEKNIPKFDTPMFISRLSEFSFI